MVMTILAVITGLHIGTAHAQEGPSGPKPKVLMLPTQGVQDAITPIVPERIGELSRKGVQNEGRVTLMPSFEEIQSRLSAQGQSSAAVAQAQELYVSGIGLLTAGEDKQAVETFQRAVDLMEQNLLDLQDFGLLSDTLVNLALAYHNAEFDLDARKAMKAYAHLKQDKVLDPEKYPEELIEIYRNEVKKVVKGGPGKLTVKSSADGATVLIDGVEKGVTPVEVDDVGFGEHYLVVRHPTAGTWTEKIRVRGRGKSQTFEAKLAGSGAAPVAEESGLPSYYTDLNQLLSTGRFSVEDIQPYFDELASQTGAEFVTWILMYKKGSSYVAAPFVFRTSDQRYVRVEETEFNIELSNLRVGVASISTSIVEAVLTMPEASVFESVELVEAKDPVVVAETPTETDGAAAAKPENEATGASAYKSGTPVQPPPEVAPSAVGTSTWTYVAYGGAVLAAGALIAGGIFLLADAGNDPASPGFNTEVSW